MTRDLPGALKLQRCSGVLLCLWSFLFVASAAAQETRHAISLNGTVIAASQIFTSPLSQDPVEKNTAYSFGATFTARASYAYTVAAAVRVEASGEIATASDTRNDNNGTPVAEGYDVRMAELCGKFFLPFTGRTFQFYIGGGGGVYWGTRRYSIAGVDARALDARAAFGILTVIGAEYQLTQSLALTAEWRFRDPVVIASNAFSQPSVESRGVTYPLEQRPFQSRINVYGNAWSVGVAVLF